MTTEDPFERAAKREEIEEYKREMRRQALFNRAKDTEGRDLISAFVALLVPYVVWGLIRAANHRFAHPIPKAILHFLFGSGFWFSAFTVVMLLCLWGAAASWASHRFGDD